MNRPRLLDLFCGAGGAGMGYHRAGFDVVGVDITPQPRYPFEFHQADALTFPLDGFDAIHASPPCQHYSVCSFIPGRDRNDYPDLVDPMRQRLQESGVPWVIENVPGAPLINPICLCGQMFDLRVYRHRLFESSFPMLGPVHERHRHRITNGSMAQYHTLEKTHMITVAGHAFRAKDGALAMGLDWPMRRDEIAEAIPPAYTMHVGGYLMTEVLRRSEVAGAQG